MFYVNIYIYIYIYISDYNFLQTQPFTEMLLKSAGLAPQNVSTVPVYDRSSRNM